MKRAAIILVGLGLLCGLIYLSWLNPTPVAFRLTPTWEINGHVGALMMAAFTAGAVVILAAVSVGAARRAVFAWRSERRRRLHRRVDEWEERGERLIWQGEVPRGRALLQKAFQRRPEDAHAVLTLAASYRDSGEMHRARGVLYDAASQHHTEPEILYALAEAHREAGEHGPCIDVLERLRALYPHAPRALRALRDAYETSGRWQDAVVLQEALVAEIRDSEGSARERERLLALRYQTALANPDPQQRLRSLEILADGRAPALPLLVSVGDTLAACGKIDEASVLWERALRGQPRTVLLERLASMAREPKHRERLRQILRKLRADSIDAHALRLVTAQLFAADGNTEATARELEAVQVGPRPPELWHRLWIDVHRQRGRLEQALAVASQPYVTGHYRCRGCERTQTAWVGYCPRCRGWDSYRASVELGRA